jgi:hypothetical protein
MYVERCNESIKVIEPTREGSIKSTYQDHSLIYLINAPKCVLSMLVQHCTNGRVEISNGRVEISKLLTYVYSTRFKSLSRVFNSPAAPRPRGRCCDLLSTDPYCVCSLTPCSPSINNIHQQHEYYFAVRGALPRSWIRFR